MAMNWVEVGVIEDVPRRGARCVNTPGGKIAVFRTADGEVFAIEDHCPHKGGPLSQGIVHGTSVTCPLHNWVISLETGKALGADEGTVRTVPTKVERERLFIALGSVAEKAA
jgi:nitrite reductase (NADH) small subunit